MEIPQTNQKPDYSKEVNRRVRVSSCDGEIVEVMTHFQSKDPVTGEPLYIPLSRPLYTVRVDTRGGKPMAKAYYVYIPKNKPFVTLKLFSDEFQFLNHHE